MKKIFAFSLSLILCSLPLCLVGSAPLETPKDPTPPPGIPVGFPDDEMKDEEGQETSVQNSIFDYTRHLGKQVDHRLDEDEIDDLQDDLEDDIDSVIKKLKDKNSFSLLGVILKNMQENTYYKYLFSSSDFTREKEAINRTHRKKFHLIRGKSPHDVLQLLGWLHITKRYSVKALHSSRPVCRNCHLLACNLFQIRLENNERGCLAIPFPPSNKMPRLALAYINNHLTLPLVEKLIVPMMGYVSRHEVQRKDQEIANLSTQLDQKNDQLAITTRQLGEKNYQLQNVTRQLEVKDEEVTNLTRQIDQKNDQLANANRQLEDKNNELQRKNEEVTNLTRQIDQKNDQLQNVTRQMEEKNNEIQLKDEQIANLSTQVDQKNDQLANANIQLQDKNNELQRKKVQISFMESLKNPLDKETEKEWFSAIKNKDVEKVKEIIAK